MSTPPSCPSCGTTPEPGDKFCPSCGRATEHPRTLNATVAEGSGPATCPHCGQEHPAPVATCKACGAKIGPALPEGSITPGTTPPDRGVGTLQSWKFTLGIAALLVVALIVFVSSRQGPEPVRTQEDPHDAGMMERIRELEAHIGEQPDDPAALLEFANLLYDVQFYQKAASMYEKHLELNPANADARVDLGTSYFQMFLADTTRGPELITQAEACFLKAIEVHPKHQLAHFNIGIIHLHRNDMPGARQWFQKAIDINPGTEAARRAGQLLTPHNQEKPQ